MALLTNVEFEKLEFNDSFHNPSPRRHEAVLKSQPQERFIYKLWYPENPSDCYFFGNLDIDFRGVKKTILIENGVAFVKDNEFAEFLINDLKYRLVKKIKIGGK